MSSTHPTKKLSEPAWDALTEALATFYWYKDDLKTFLYRQLNDHHDVLARLDFGLSKRQIASSLTGVLARDERRYQPVAIELLVTLSKFDATFSRLAGLEDGAAKVERARSAHAALLHVIGDHVDLVEERQRLKSELEEHAQRNAARRSHDAVLTELHEEFFTMYGMTERQERGRLFERFLNSLFELYDLDPRAAYNLSHEQIDGAFTFDTDDYLLEARWWDSPMQPADIHPFKVKIESKSKHTIGLFISTNGFTAGAIELYSQATPIIFMDGADLVSILEARIALSEVLLRKRRHAAETGNPMLPVTRMLG